MVSKVSNKLILLLVAAALFPLLTFGIISLKTSRQTASKLATERNMKVAQRAAGEIAVYLDSNNRILRSIAATVSRTHLQPWEKTAILRDHILEFKEFQTIHLINSQGKVVTTSSTKKNPRVPEDEAFQVALEKGIPYRSSVFITDELMPTISIGFPMTKRGKPSGMILGVVNLLDVWRVVDNIKVGQKGHALIVSNTRQLLAHGSPKFLQYVIEQKVFNSHPLVKEVLEDRGVSGIYTNKDGLQMLSVGVPIPGMNWALLIDQPLKEAFLETRTMTRRLSIFVILFTLLACMIGLIGGRSYVIEPINRLIDITRTFAKGTLDKRVHISSKDEFGELGRAFNSMASDLEVLKEDIKRKEREATLGLIASGLVHDLKHPLRNIENMTSLMDKRIEDRKYLQTFKTTVQREMEVINQYFEDLADVSTTKPLHLVTINIIEHLGKLCDQLQTTTASQGVELDRDFPDESLIISADVHALNRVLNNIISNALDAMPEGGNLRVAAKKVSEDTGKVSERIVEISIEDTGPGIPREILEKIFDGFVSTKRKGLGLGLLISKKLTEAHGGRLNIRSSEAKGTTCSIAFPLLNS